jgi:hypothetical protein
VDGWCETSGLKWVLIISSGCWSMWDSWKMIHGRVTHGLRNCWLAARYLHRGGSDDQVIVVTNVSGLVIPLYFVFCSCLIYGIVLTAQKYWEI